MYMSYYEHTSGNYHATLHEAGQTISVSSGYFREIMRMKGYVVAGTSEISVAKALELGFVISEEAGNVGRVSSY